MDHFGDNDTLSAVVAQLIHADVLIILTDIDGFYNGNPKVSNDVELIDTVTELTDEIRHYAGGEGTKLGTGGMVTKLNAADIATNSGIHMVLADGEDPFIVFKILDGVKVGTMFVGKNKII
jgi:glutamate 5-kinase